MSTWGPPSCQSVFRHGIESDQLRLKTYVSLLRAIGADSMRLKYTAPLKYSELRR